MARLLDGGVLTRWGARAPARGPATVPGLAMAARSAFLARGCSVAAVIAAAEKRERAKREKGEEPNELGFSGPRAASGFYPSDGNGRPSDGEERRQMRGPASRPRRVCAAEALCRPRPRLRPGCGLGERADAGLSWAAAARAAGRATLLGELGRAGLK